MLCFKQTRPRYRIALLSPFLLAATMLAAQPSTGLAANLSGIDVSHHDGEVDWPRVKEAGFAFAFAKSSEGADFTDPRFAANWREMKEARLVRGAYHYFRVGDDPLAQARNVARRVTLEPGDLPIVVDIESMNKTTEESSRLRADLAAFVKAIEDHFGLKPIIYTSPDFWNQHVGGGFTEYPLWVAEYGVTKPKEVVGWDHWVFWQTSETGSIEAVDGHIDLDVFAGTTEELEALTKK